MTRRSSSLTSTTSSKSAAAHSNNHSYYSQSTVSTATSASASASASTTSVFEGGPGLSHPSVVTPSSAGRGATGVARRNDPTANSTTIATTATTTTTTTMTTPSGHTHPSTSAAVIQETGCSECDFDGKKGPTKIWMAIEDQDWNKVIHQCQHSPIEVRTYVFRRNNNNSNNNKSSSGSNSNSNRNGGDDGRRNSGSNKSIQWRMLPLHAAVISDAPANVISSLLKAYRDGAKAVDDYRMLPIHLAIKKHADPQRINLLLAAFPGCVDIQNNHGQRPIDMSETSSSPHKEYYLRAMRRNSSTYNAVTNTVDDLMCGLFTTQVDDFVMNIDDIRSAIVSVVGSSSLNMSLS